MPATNIKTLAFLASMPLFKELAADEIDRIAAGTTELHVPRGQILFVPGFDLRLRSHEGYRSKREAFALLSQDTKE